MMRIMLSILAGLCLAILIGCNSSGPTFPAEWGLTVKDINAAQVVSNQNIGIEWGTENELLSSFKVYVSYNETGDYELIEETSSQSIIWKVPPNTSSEAMFKIEGFNSNYSTEPLGTALSNTFTIHPHGDTFQYHIEALGEIRSGEDVVITITAKDEWENDVPTQNIILINLMVDPTFITVSKMSDAVQMENGQGELHICLFAPQSMSAILKIEITDDNDLYTINIPFEII